VQETALSRVGMSAMALGLPAVFILILKAIRINPTSPALKTLLEVNCIGLALTIGLPGSVSIFPPISSRKGSDLEKEFSTHNTIYFSKGL